MSEKVTVVPESVKNEIKSYLDTLKSTEASLKKVMEISATCLGISGPFKLNEQLDYVTEVTEGSKLPEGPKATVKRLKNKVKPEVIDNGTSNSSSAV